MEHFPSECVKMYFIDSFIGKFLFFEGERI